MWRAFGCLVAYFVLALMPHASAADFSVDSSDPKLAVVSISGELLPNDHKIFISKTLNLDAAIVVFYSNGGNLVSGLEIGKAIRLKEFQTYVPDDSLCASACALAWLGGTPRYLSKSASVGFHAAFINHGEGVNTESGMANAMVGAYLNSLGLPTRAVTYMTFAAPASMQWLTVDDAEELGIDVKLFDVNGGDKLCQVAA